jgi:hypothetical protein
VFKAIQKWIYHFEEGEHSLEDEPRSDYARSTEYVNAIRALLANNICLSNKRIACILGIHQNIVKRVLPEDLSIRKVNFKWIPHLFDDDEKLKRVRLSTELPEFLESKSEYSLANIYTGNEMWIHCNNPRSSMCPGVDVARPIRFRSFIGATKVMI